MTDAVAVLLARLPERIDQVIAQSLSQTPEHPALVERDGVWTYAQLARAIAAATDRLAASGVQPGDRVMIVADNGRAVAALLLAVSSLEAWPVLVNPRLSEREIDEIRAHCRPRRVLYTIGASVQARAHAERDGAATESVDALGTVGIGALDSATAPEPIAADPAERVAVLIYTSGSSGKPKGVMLTHRNLLFMAAVSGGIRNLTPEDRLYGVLPLSHVVGLSVVLLGGLMHGAAIHLTPRFNPAEAIAAMVQERLTVMLGAPAMYALLLDYAGRKGMSRLSAPALRIISVSGAPLDPAMKAATERLFGMPLHHGYGITECGPTIAQVRPDRPREDCSVGPLLPGVEARLVGGGDIGELHVRGPNVMRGYYRAPEDTAAAVDAQGWFNTGDLARFEDDHLFIVGRSKELIIRFGFNVYPPEIEAVLNAHPGVRQSAVVGRPDGADEAVIAFVEPLPGAVLDANELAEYAASRLAPYKRPTAIHLRTELPTTTSGKIAKRELLVSP